MTYVTTFTTDGSVDALVSEILLVSGNTATLRFLVRGFASGDSITSVKLYAKLDYADSDLHIDTIRITGTLSTPARDANARVVEFALTTDQTTRLLSGRVYRVEVVNVRSAVTHTRTVATGFIAAALPGATAVAPSDEATLRAQGDATLLSAFSAKVGSVTGTANRVTIGGTATAPTVDIASTYAGQTTITAVGTIAAGTWQGTAVADTYLATIATAGKVSNSATTATSVNTASAIVARDASGNFAAALATLTSGHVTGTVGIGGSAPNTVTALYVTSSALTSTVQSGMQVQITATSAATDSAYGVYSRMFTQAATFTLTHAYAFYAANPSKGAGSTITNGYGLYVASQTAGSAFNYGLYVEAPSGGSTINTGIKCNVGDIGLNVTGPTTGAAATKSAISCNPTWDSTTITRAYSVYSGATVAAAATVANMYAFYADNQALGAGATVTNAYGLYVDGPTVGSTLNFAIYSNGTAPTSLGGAFTVRAGGVTITGASTITGSLSGLSSLAVNGGSGISVTSFAQAAGTYGYDLLATGGADRSLLRVGVAAVTNGLTAIYRTATTNIEWLFANSKSFTIDAGGITVTGNSTITGTLSGITTLTATTVIGALTGNATTATALATPRTINGTSFDGSANVTVTAAATTLTGAALAANVLASSLTSVGTLAALTVGGDFIVNAGGRASFLAYAGASGTYGLDVAVAGGANRSIARFGVTAVSNGLAIDYASGTGRITYSYSDGVIVSTASVAGGAGLRVPHGTAPSSPVDGDIWTTTLGMFCRINGVTKTVTLT